MQHPRTAVVATTALIGEAASPAVSRTAAVRTGEVAEGQVALREATSEASTGLAGRLIQSRPQQWMLSLINAQMFPYYCVFFFLSLIVYSRNEKVLCYFSRVYVVLHYHCSL
jgi:hypothetical protein